ncbi:MAG TPA: RecQ family ATP-dependent DNA helicase [Chloroflexia bacterium]|nr:RecQ family ATP-dependent DNA helicase [Chloroflexia bacterium]
MVATSDALHDALFKHFGYSEFRPGQREVLDCLLNGQDVLAVFPTGAGKSLTYQLAALMLPGTAIVVSPLIALMRDQVVDLQSRRIEGVSAINSTLTEQEVNDSLDDLAGGDEKILYVTPERCSDPDFLDHLKETNVCLFVVDEAHCISEWGYDFRPAYLMLDKAIKAAKRPPVLALTATATPQVRADIHANLGLKDPCVIIHGFDRPNLVFDVLSASTDREKDWQLLKLFGKAPSGKGGDASGYVNPNGHKRELPAGIDPELAAKIEYLNGTLEGPGLVYVATTSEARRVSALLNEAGIKAAFYHGQMRKSDRDRVQQEWMDEVTPVVVATTAFGMGINKPNLRYVVHYDLPASLEAYYQEAGRAGRDGKPAKAVLIYDPRDRNIQSFFIGGSVPSETSLRELWDDIRRVLRQKEREVGEGRVNSLPIGEVAKIRNLPIARVRPLLAALEQAGGVAVLSGNGDNNDIATFRKTNVLGRRLRLDMKKLQARKQYEQSRLDMMLRYASSRECRRKLMLGYFGEHYEKDNCGACDNCIHDNENNSISIEQRAVPVPATPFRTGAIVTHRKWGDGTVQTMENNTVTVHFPDVGYKTLALDVVLNSGILSPVA